MKMTKRCILAVTAFAVLAAWTPLCAAEADDVLSQIERLVALGEDAEPALTEAVVVRIKENPALVSRAIAARLKDGSLTQQQLAVYLWALGQSGDPAMAGAIVALHGKSESDQIRSTCLHALAEIGGRQAGDYLLSVLDATAGDERFDILNLLGQMQYEAALPKAEEVLKQDPRQFYWQSIFVFGKMGDKAVPFLLERVNHKDRNIRANAIHVLGQWLIPPAAAKPMQDRFWMETDTELRGLILSSLERTILDPAQMKTFFEQVVAREKNPELQKYAQETLESMSQMRADVAAFVRKKQPSAASFQSEYAKLFKSAGKEGSYENLAVSSTAQDEPKLKALRERILQRDSDESFYDYQQVNGIIMRNRLADRLRDQNTSRPDAVGK